MVGLTVNSTSLKALANLGSSIAWLFHQAIGSRSGSGSRRSTCRSNLAGSGYSHRNSKLILCPFCLLDKIDSPFCLQNCFFLLAVHFAQILLSKFCQGLATTTHTTHTKSNLFESSINMGRPQPVVFSFSFRVHCLITSLLL